MCLPKPGSNRGYAASVFVDSLVLMLQGGGQSLEDLRALERERAMMELIERDEIPDPDSWPIAEYFIRDFLQLGNEFLGIYCY